MVYVFSVLLVISATLTIVSKYIPNKRMEYIFKPLTMVWALLLAILAEDPLSNTYQVLIVLGLLSSMAGDVMLIMPDRFVEGLVCFLVAHLLYIAAFTLEGDGTAPLWYIIPFLAFGGFVLRRLWPYLENMRVPVIIYTSAILLMAWQAANRWLEVGGQPAMLALIGAYLFLASDTALAFERFRGTWRSAPFWVLSLYFAAQWLIALSV